MTDTDVMTVGGRFVPRNDGWDAGNQNLNFGVYFVTGVMGICYVFVSICRVFVFQACF
jgi:hypothetical protein